VSERFTKVHFDFDALPALTTPWRKLGATGVALGLIRLEPGKGYTFTHEHREQEEVYVVLAGTGTLLVDGELLPLERGDAIRVAPAARRALRAAPDATLLVLCAGAVPAGYPRDPEARYLIDDGIPHYDDVPPWCAGDAEVLKKNAELAERMRRSAERRGE
jgi:mannose-6-phosphate isomerase-like protein (cupin superfamily)